MAEPYASYQVTQPSPHKGVVGLTLQPGRGSLVDQFLVMLWLVVVPLEFPMAAPFRYPVTALVLLAVIINWREVLPLLRRGAFFFALPALCLLSALWSDAPMLSIRFGVFMAVTLVICAYTAARLDHRQFVVTIFVASTLLMAGSLLFMQTTFIGGVNGEQVMIGIYPHKNVLGMRMLVHILAAMVIILDRRYMAFWRLTALATMPVALYLLLGSKSATALILLAASAPMIAMFGGIWPVFAKIKGLRLLLASGSIILLAGSSLLVANVYRINPYTELLERLGKDTTLTGRTVIWEAGNRIIENNPLAGIGAGAFWRPGVDQATRISTMFGAENNQFYFHNAYYEVMVHLGIIGLVLFLITISKAYWILIRNWLIRQNTVDGFVLTIAAILLVRSFTESELFSVFILNPMIFWTGVFMVLYTRINQQRINISQPDGRYPPPKASAIH